MKQTGKHSNENAVTSTGNARETGETGARQRCFPPPALWGGNTSPPPEHLRAPTDRGAGTGDPWCHFATGLYCTNGEHCLNPNHRRAQ